MLQLASFDWLSGNGAFSCSLLYICCHSLNGVNYSLNGVNSRKKQNFTEIPVKMRYCKLTGFWQTTKENMLQHISLLTWTYWHGFPFHHMPLLCLPWLIAFCEFKEVRNIVHQNLVGINNKMLTVSSPDLLEQVLIISNR